MVAKSLSQPKLNICASFLIPGYPGNTTFSNFLKKLSRSVGMVYKMKNLGCDEKILLSLYFSLFQSHLCYGLVAWGSSFYAKNLFVIRKRSIRAIAGLSFNDSTSDSFNKIKILTLEILYRSKLASFMWNFDHGVLLVTYKNFSRNHQNFLVTAHAALLMLTSLKISAARLK